MYSDVKATRLTASGAVFAGPARVKKICYLAGAVAGTITVRDGGASGTIVAVIDTPADAAVALDVDMPENGLRCSTNAYVVFDNAVAVTVFYA
jgi:hypothetical protein